MAENTIYPVSGFPSGVACTINCYDKPPIFCPDNPIPFYAVMGDSQGGSGSTLRVSTFDINNNWVAVPDAPPLSEQPAQNTQVYSLAYNKTGTRLASTHRRDGGVSVWNTLDWTNLNVPDLLWDGTTGEDGANAVPQYGTFNYNDTQFLVAYSGASGGPTPYFTWYQLYNISGDTWTLATNMDLLFQGDANHPNPAAYSWQVAYSRDGLYLSVPFIGGNWEFRVYSASDYASIYELENQPDPTATNIAEGANGTAWHPIVPSRWLAFTSQESPGVWLYEVNQINPNPPNIWPLISLGPSFVPIPNGVQNYRCAFSPNGQYFAFGSAQSPYLFVYDVSVINDWQPVTLGGTPNALISDVAFSKDSKWLIAAKPSGASPHGYAYDIENNWALVASDDLNLSPIAWYCGQIPEQE